MAEEIPAKKTHKEWRKEVKKLRRKKLRRKLAEEQRKKEEEEEAARLKDPDYVAWLNIQEELERVHEEQEEKERQEQEEQWLRRELLAEKQFRAEKRKAEAIAAVKEAERKRIQKEFEELQLKAQKRREERKKREEQIQREFELYLKKIDEYIEVGGPVPPELNAKVNSNPNKEVCPFFSRTNACRYGLKCCRNHIRPSLSKILFFPNFFTHIKLEQSGDTEYGSDINLEYTNKELYDDYGEFFNDVVDELKLHGQIENFRTCMNSQPHLRGNVFIEYTTERDALRAYMKMQGRYYASRRINVEFSNIASWKTAVCGLWYAKRCPKGRDCNFLHIFRNPGNLYNTPLVRRDDSIGKSSRRVTQTNSAPSWNDGDDQNTRNWRWSESPEPKPNGNRDDKSYLKGRNSRYHSQSKSSSHQQERTSKSSRSSSKRSRSRDRNRRSRSSSRKTRNSRDHSYSKSSRHQQEGTHQSSEVSNAKRSRSRDRRERSISSSLKKRSSRERSLNRQQKSQRGSHSKTPQRSKNTDIKDEHRQKKKHKSRNSSPSKERKSKKAK